MEKQSLEIFDFDGTLTSSDTLLALIRFARGRSGLLWVLLRHTHWLVLMRMGLANNGRVKERVLRYCFGGWEQTRWEQLCNDFAFSHTHLWRPQAVRHISQQLEKGQAVAVISASVVTWVRPFFAQWRQYMEKQNGQEPLLRIVGTEMEVHQQHLTGRMATPNCYGAEKVRRAEKLLTAPRNHFVITAYGDSKGDQALLHWADKAVWRPFREENNEPSSH